MTREEAIQHLENLKISYPFADVSEWVDMAIEALQTDVVSREHHDMEIKELKHQIKDQADMVSVVRCKDCRYFKKIVERSDSGLCHRDLVASAWKENGYCSRGERREP